MTTATATFTRTRVMPTDLWFLVYANILMVTLIYLWPVSFLRIIMGVLFTFFIPGYAFWRAFHPSSSGPTNVQTLAGSVGLSMVINGLTLLPLAYFKYFSKETNVFVTISVVMLLVLIAAWRISSANLLNKLETQQNNTKTNHSFIAAIQYAWHTGRKTIWVLHISSVIFLLVALIHLIWTTSGVRPEFTEFYILDQSGRLDQYPSRTETVTEDSEIVNEINVVLGITNHEYQTTSYNLFYRINNGEDHLLNTVELDNAQTWESDTQIALKPSAEQRKLTFELRRNNDDQIYSSLYIWVDPIVE
ncbi:MAG: DUF1616 domain-containing protein [Caldilineaceae bacterium]|nr:DUF1616 domain-containing protein [Caldilineaceae bacterium]